MRFRYTWQQNWCWLRNQFFWHPITKAEPLVMLVRIEGSDVGSRTLLHFVSKPIDDLCHFRDDNIWVEAAFYTMPRSSTKLKSIPECGTSPVAPAHFRATAVGHTMALKRYSQWAHPCFGVPRHSSKAYHTERNRHISDVVGVGGMGAFRGLPNEDFGEFYENYETLAALKNWTERQKKARLTLHTAGPA
ncbi:hypothetical protein EVAR_36322_1 [Eumeta japonica]|uniref:Uncharacterized protein n=1 Tax=Eumeta variegata TaxID=151549 RepID=A0A4C1VIF2_EUMVA|nr:hypothetical protein EVAR_36322_1 [Eumeta japonica]